MHNSWDTNIASIVCCNKHETISAICQKAAWCSEVEIDYVTLAWCNQDRPIRNSRCYCLHWLLSSNTLKLQYIYVTVHAQQLSAWSDQISDEYNEEQLENMTYLKLSKTIIIFMFNMYAPVVRQLLSNSRSWRRSVVRRHQIINYVIPMAAASVAVCSHSIVIWMVSVHCDRQLTVITCWCGAKWCQWKTFAMPNSAAFYYFYFRMVTDNDAGTVDGTKRKTTKMKCLFVKSQLIVFESSIGQKVPK
jgi:hypothetical protein